MSQVVQAMRRQLPTARRLLEDLSRPGASVTGDPVPGMALAEAVQLLTRFVMAFQPGGSPASEISTWVKIGPALNRAAQSEAER